MKKVDFNRKFKNFKGLESGNETIAEEIAKILYSAGLPELPVSTDEKYRAYKISTKLISHNGVVELDDEDITFLKSFSNRAFAAGAYGQIMEILNS